MRVQSHQLRNGYRAIYEPDSEILIVLAGRRVELASAGIRADLFAELLATGAGQPMARAVSDINNALATINVAYPVPDFHPIYENLAHLAQLLAEPATSRRLRISASEADPAYVYAFTEPARERELCGRDGDCTGSHFWICLPVNDSPAPGELEYCVFHVNSDTGCVVPPTPLEVLY